MQFELTKLKQAMIAQVDRNDLASNNLANINTTGFKKDQLFFHTLEEELDIDKSMSHATDFSQGTVFETGNPFDLAISGRGFFMVEMDDDVGFTRDGSFHIDQDGIMRNKSNLPVMGEAGMINVISEFGVPKQVMITEKGEVFADSELVDRIIITDFESEKALQKIGSSLFKANLGAIEYTIEEPNIKQGFLEGSNVNPAQEMIDLIEIQREFEGIQRMVRSLDDVYKQAVQNVGHYRT